MFFPFDLLICSRSNPTPKIQPSAICVELTGKPSWLAKITVIAAAKATENALTWFSFVISQPTVAISLLPKIIKPRERPAAHKNIIQKGIETLSVFKPADWIVSLIATNGHIALATSFAPCAKESKATAHISGKLKSLLMYFLLSLNSDLCFLRYKRVSIIVEIPITTPINKEVVGVTIADSHSEDFTNGFNHFNMR